VAFFAVKGSYVHGPIWVADSARSDVYYYGQSNALPDGTPLIANVSPTSIVARFTSEETGAPLSVGLWLYNVAQDTWDGCAASRQVTAALPPTAVPTVTPTPKFTVTPMSTATPVPQVATSTAVPVSTAVPWASPTPAAVPLITPTPEGELVVALDAVVLDNGAELRSGATMWWDPSTELPEGSTVRVLGYNPETPDWVYVGTSDGQVSGWTQVTNLRFPGSLLKLSLVTPVPTLTPSPTATSTPTPTPTVACPGGPFRAEAWPMRAYRSPEGGWIAVIYARGYGGTCEYTYQWNVDIEKGPMFDGVFFEFHQDRYEALIGTVTVSSGQEEIVVGIYVPSP